MWLDKVKELKKKTGTTSKYIAEKTHRSERTISRFFAGEATLGIDDVREIVLLMGGSLDDILDESDFRMPTPEIEALKKENASLSATIEEMTANGVILKAEISVLKNKISSLSAENELLLLKLQHKEEIIAIHNYYNKIKSGE